jgi:hydroxymethylbilane synthase
MQTPQIRIGSRGSRLAIIQAQEVKKRLVERVGIDAARVEILTIVTTGDRIKDRNLTEIGGKGLFTKEIEDALLSGNIDLAVHSMKDLPAVIPNGLAIGAVLAREDPRDALVSSKARSIKSLPQEALIGSSSVRRTAQLKRRRSDLRFTSFRGNVDTRLKKLREGQVDATLLACAGLIRLGLKHEITAAIEVDDMLPALGQGAIGVEIRSANGVLAEMIKAVDDEQTAVAIACERAFLKELDGSCKTPIAGFARIENGRLLFRGETLTPDGSQVFTAEREGLPQDAEVMGRDAGVEVKRKGRHIVL